MNGRYTQYRMINLVVDDAYVILLNENLYTGQRHFACQDKKQEQILQGGV